MIATYLTMQRAILGRLSPRLFVRLAGRFAGIVGEKAAGSLDTILKSMGAKRRCTWTFLSALLIGAARCHQTAVAGPALYFLQRGSEDCIAAIC
jgi:hypothetical protein